MTIAGKSWCRHMVDQCSRLNASDVYIVDCFYRVDLPRRMGNGDYWSLSLHYISGVPCGQPEDLLQHYREIPRDDDLLFVWGQVMPDVPDMHQLLNNLREVKEMPEVLPEGIWLYRGGKYYECVCPLLRIHTLQDYFDLNFRLLKKPGIYNLPGYSNNEGCVFGMDVMILPECELEKPVLILDNVRLERGVSLCREVIVGRNVLINEGTRLEHTIVMDHTCIGRHMDFRDKIIDRVRVIDVPSGVCVDLNDDALTGSSLNRGINRYTLAEYLLALLICFGGLPLFLLSLPFRKWLNKLAFFYFMSQVYPKCWLVLAGRANLVRFGRNDREYAFRYSDQWVLHRDEHQKFADDVYFYHNRSIHNILRTVVVSMLKRIVIMQPLPSDDRSLAEQEEL